MDTRLNAAQAAIRERFGELFDEELTPSIRRMGEQPREAASVAEVDQLRRLVWQALTDLGGTRLLLPREHGGAAAGQQGAVVLAELLGGALYQGPLLDTMTATQILAADPAGGELLGQIAEGAPVVLAGREHGSDELADPGPLELTAGRVSARRRFVNHAAQAEYLAVLGSRHGRPTCAVVARADPTVSLRRQQDTGRGELYDVTLQDTPALAVPEGFAVQWRAILAAARLRQAGYLVGMCRAGLDLAVRRVRDRRQFDQPIGRFQAPA
ncbi:MAG TPA: acyl-CoA dehydrogenase family protein, partial [Jatrophihabitans sp.]|nr:acyl-CoA dehydrogenase family protein [Jatrophihabitans sp.]